MVQTCFTDVSFYMKCNFTDFCIFMVFTFVELFFANFRYILIYEWIQIKVLFLIGTSQYFVILLIVHFGIFKCISQYLVKSNFLVL